MEKVAAIRGTANNLAFCIDRSATAARIATNRPSQGSEVPYFGVFPQKWILRGNARRLVRCEASLGKSYNDSRSLIVATGAGESVRSAQSTNVAKLPLFPQKSSHLHTEGRKGIGN